jgi:hypothetical protein
VLVGLPVRPARCGASIGLRVSVYVENRCSMVRSRWRQWITIQSAHSTQGDRAVLLT